MTKRRTVLQFEDDKLSSVWETEPSGVKTRAFYRDEDLDIPEPPTAYEPPTWFYGEAPADATAAKFRAEENDVAQEKLHRAYNFESLREEVQQWALRRNGHVLPWTRVLAGKLYLALVRERKQADAIGNDLDRAYKDLGERERENADLQAQVTRMSAQLLFKEATIQNLQANVRVLEGVVSAVLR